MEHKASALDANDQRMMPFLTSTATALGTCSAPNIVMPPLPFKLRQSSSEHSGSLYRIWAVTMQPADHCVRLSTHRRCISGHLWFAMASLTAAHAGLDVEHIGSALERNDQLMAPSLTLAERALVTSDWPSTVMPPFPSRLRQLSTAQSGV